MPKLVRRLITGLSLTLAAMALLAAGLYFAAQQPPDFYRQSLAQNASTISASGERLEEQALALHNQLHHEGRFEVHFTQDEINAWLSDELPARFPRLLPAAFSDPRVAIDEGKLRLAVRYQRGNVETVLSLTGKAHLTGQPNELAIYIGQARAGWLPVPLGRLLEDVQNRAARAGIPIRWSDDQGEPVGLVRIPSHLEGDEYEQPHRFVLEDLRIQQHELVVVGRTEFFEREMGPDGAPSSAVIQPSESDTHQR